MMTSTVRNRRALLGVASCLCLTQTAWATDIDTLLDLPFEALFDLTVSTATKTEEKISDVAANVVVIGRADIAQQGYRNLAEVLSSIPGLYHIEQYYHEGAAFGVRGFWSSWTNKQLIILVDGIPQMNPQRNNYILPQIAVPVEAIERVEVVRGPLSVIYGDGAFFGAINIITDKKRIAQAEKNQQKQEDLSDIQTTLSAGFGSQATGKLYARVSGGNKAGDLFYTLTASHYSTDGIAADYHEMVDAGYLETLTGFSGTENTKGKLQNAENYLSLNAHIKDFSFLFSHVETENEAFLVFPNDLDGNHQRHTVSTLGLSYKKALTEALSLQARFNYRQNELLYDYMPTAFIHAGARAAEERRQGKIYEAELTGTYALENARMIMGLSYRSIPEVTGYIDAPNAGLDTHYYEVTDSITSNGLFAQVSYDFSDRFTMVAGARLERLENYTIRTRSINDPAALDSSREYDKGSTEIIPRLAAIYRASEQHAFKFLYGEAVSWPSFDQNQPQVINPRLHQLEPESVRTFELVYDYTPASHFAANFSVFRNEMKNLIVRSLTFDNAQLLEIQTNSGALTTTGLEGTLRYRLGRQWNFELSGSYQRTDDTKNNQDAAYSPELLGYFKTAYHFNKGRMTKGLSIALDAHYVSTMQPAVNLNSTNSPPERIGQDADAYFNMGLNLRVEDRLIKGTFMNVRISNVLDEEIRYPVFTSNAWATRGYIGEGRSVLFNVGMTF